MSELIVYGPFTIEVVAVDSLDLLEKNARFMRNETFRRLVENVKQDGQLSQIPFCVRRPGDRFLVLSGNHRVKAAKAADLTAIPVVYYTDKVLTPDEELAIQLSHNAIAGEDDPVILKELWDGLESVTLKQYSGLDDKILGALLKAPMPALSDVRLDFRTTTFLFLPEEVERVKAVFAEAKDLVKGEAVLLARLSEYDQLLDAIAATNSAYGIANGATGLLVLLEIFARHQTDLVDGWFDGETQAIKRKGWVPMSSIFGSDTMPAEAALVVKQAVEKMVGNGDLESTSRWLAVERWAADYLAGA